MNDQLCFVQRSPISNGAKIIANENQFVIESYRFHAESSNDSRIVKIGSVQSSIKTPATASVDEVKKNIFGKVERIIEAAAAENVNILCLPEMWCITITTQITYESDESDAYNPITLSVNSDLNSGNDVDMPYPFYTPNDVAWKDFAEDDETGASTNLMKKLAAKLRMIIISSILEKDSSMFFNTTLIISTTGNIIGKYRKIHIPPIEQPYLQSGPFEHPVFDTEFGKIGIVICYERHFPLCWMMHGLEQADIVFNPSSEDGPSTMSERLWLTEGVNAAVPNGFFTAMVNRTGTETFRDGSSFCYFGSSYVASPFGYVTPPLTGDEEGLLITEIDLNDCRKVKMEFSIHQNNHVDLYINKLSQTKLK